MRIERLKKRADFLHLTSNGRRAVAAGMVVQRLPNRLEKARIGFTVTKKIGNAVARNRVRRRLREVVRLCFSECGQEGYDYVIIGRACAKDRPFEALKQDFVSAVGALSKPEKEALS